ncbi:MAG: tetratricopeptide repeat protein [Gammaproteobacteria bacterium]|nr:tetratricopeptide repeat protein [Gammaproteobacteria bacterium]NIM71642.1 tetratricopeptide repeat protein [Gammaproteobacteria bacterium]NIO23382.1 tetratricopeptide repeat protein [Gammaproteobacteria bacterium]NIO64010.1 tetratricopeptide repeat protein [Gammaproteobacteria bacterium]NIP47101.1 tetratricopeptide repeat protein [Gammaproteobacteria bacterium]
MKTAHKIAAGASLGLLLITVLPGCAAPGRNLDADALWESTERRHSVAIRAIAERHQLESDYAAIIRISRDGALRGQAFMQLAELHIALGEYDEARRNIEQALRASLPHEQRRQALLMLGDLLERHLEKRERAMIAYRQIVGEYPGTAETELALLRLKVLEHEQ